MSEMGLWGEIMKLRAEIAALTKERDAIIELCEANPTAYVSDLLPHIRKGTLRPHPRTRQERQGENE